MRLTRTYGLKRPMDIAVSGLGLLLLSPIFLIIAAMIAVTMGRPLLFRQTRPGFAERPFDILKFRTMRSAEPGSPPGHADEQRLTALGRFLRATSLDELPELLNVLRGEMSLVGPRPLLMEYLPRYSSTQRRRHEARPGITGLAQVRGRNALDWDEKFRHDVWYVDHLGLWLDLKILLMTATTVVSRHGIAAPGHATMPMFMGSAAPVDEVQSRQEAPERDGSGTL